MGSGGARNIACDEVEGIRGTDAILEGQNGSRSGSGFVVGEESGILHYFVRDDRRLLGLFMTHLDHRHRCWVGRR